MPTCAEGQHATEENGAIHNLLCSVFEQFAGTVCQPSGLTMCPRDAQTTMHASAAVSVRHQGVRMPVPLPSGVAWTALRLGQLGPSASIASSRALESDIHNASGPGTTARGSRWSVRNHQVMQASLLSPGLLHL